MKYAVVLRSKHSGDQIFLGSKHASREDAESYVAEEVCLRCNRVEYLPVADDATWRGRHEGWRS